MGVERIRVGESVYGEEGGEVKWDCISVHGR